MNNTNTIQASQATKLTKQALANQHPKLLNSQNTKSNKTSLTKSNVTIVTQHSNTIKSTNHPKYHPHQHHQIQQANTYQPIETAPQS